MGGVLSSQDAKTRKKSKRERAAERLPTKTTTKGDPEWDNMMDFFKQNPSALMDALPTPPGSDCGSQAGDNQYTSKLGNSTYKSSVKSTKSKALGLSANRLRPGDQLAKKGMDQPSFQMNRSNKNDL